MIRSEQVGTPAYLHKSFCHVREGDEQKWRWLCKHCAAGCSATKLLKLGSLRTTGLDEDIDGDSDIPLARFLCKRTAPSFRPDLFSQS